MPLLLVRDKRASSIREKIDATDAKETMAFCPRCKALQTIWLIGNVLMQTRKFTQRDGQVFHNCGSDRPCRLYFSW